MQKTKQVSDSENRAKLITLAAALLPLSLILFVVARGNELRAFLAAVYLLAAFGVARKMKLHLAAQVLIALTGVVLLGGFIYVALLR